GTLNVQFSAVASGGNGTDANLTNWSFGDGPSSYAIGATANHTYSSFGFYVATARLTDGSGFNATEAFVLDDFAGGGPPAVLVMDATVTPAGGAPAGAPLQFRATVFGGFAPYRVHWDLGPNASAFGLSANQSYPAGFCPNPPTCRFNAYLNVTDLAGTVLSAIIPIAPAVGPAGTALALSETVRPTGGPTPLYVVGNASTSGMPNPTVTWNFGIGSPLVGSPRGYTYLAPGNYTITDTATDAFGDRVVHSHAAAVSGLTRTLPTISGGPNVTQGFAPIAISFSVQASGGAGAPFTYAWDFGDGGTASASGSVSHTYNISANYTASVTVTDAIGTPTTVSWTIVVYNTTAVLVTVTGPSAPLLPAGWVNFSVAAFALCTNRSAPRCPGSLDSFYLAAASNPGIPWLFGTLDANGSGGGGFRASSQPGHYAYEIVVASTNYTGTGSFAFDVLAPTCACPDRPGNSSSPLLWEIALGGIVVVGAIGVAAIVLYRRRSRAGPPSP
ncbi:MAG: PKD domain-containing protein, partial [Thermoplasmata archaeon]|nr:PKD domain-containing protein [Thermoplasmata archaeon]